MIPHSHRPHWLLWVALVAFVVSGVLAMRASSIPTTAKLRLAEGAETVVTTFRLFSDPVRLSLDFDRSAGAKRPELGNFASRSADGYVEFPNPGVPIRVRLKGSSRAADIDYEALPAGSYNRNYIGRDLVLFKDDGQASRFPWPPELASRPILPPGSSSFKVTVLQVGPELVGEEVTLVVEPPVTLTTTSPGYGFLWWFVFWPAYAAILAAYAGVLLWRSLRMKNARNTAQ